MPNTENVETLPSSRVYVGAPVAGTLAYIAHLRFMHRGADTFARIMDTDGKIHNVKITY